MDEVKPTGKTVDKGKLGLNYKILAIIGALTIGDIIYAMYFFEGEFFDISDGYYLAQIAICGIFSIFVAKRYVGSKMLGKAYLFLGLGFFGWFFADVGYYYQEFVLMTDPWPSPFDSGLIANYIFASIHLYLNTRYFKPKWSIGMKLALIGIPVIAVSSFTMIAHNAWGDYDGLLFDLVYSNVFVVGISITLALAVLGASVFRHSILKTTWLLLAFGIFLWAVGDSIYTYLVTIDAYTHNNPISAFWTAALLLIIYALYKHHKAV